MSVLQHTRVLLVLLFFCALALGIKGREFVNDMTSDKEADVVTYEQTELDPVKFDLGFPDKILASIEPAAEAESEAASEPMPEAELEEAKDDESMLGDAPEVESKEWRDAMDAELEYSGIQSELFEDLTERRKDLEKKEKALAMKDALLKAAERELDQKYAELEALKSEIEVLLVKQTEEEEARISRLVKIYEGMKAKDAARIFNTLETDVLLSVLSRMSERKSAPVIASMNPDRARSVTILLAEQKRLPDLSSQ